MPGAGAWGAGDTGIDSWNDADTSGEGAADSWVGGGVGARGGDDTCRICNQTGHYARQCPDQPVGGGLTGECFNCGEVGHNKADCTNPRVEREFTGTCRECGVEGHTARNCPTSPMKCKLCDKEGHKALECKERRVVDWTGVPELEPEEAWTKLIQAAIEKDLDAFRTCLKAYARSIVDDFSLPDVEAALRSDGLPIYLIAKKQEVAANMTVVDLVGNPEREYVLTVQLSDKPRRAKMAEGWPENAVQNLERLASAGFVQDRGVPLCGNCGELGHIRKASDPVPYGRTLLTEHSIANKSNLSLFL
ncbi:zinc knuckle [Stagonosporopsis vannaccii]|nr:zinc knuckle [Stagonosporopsis vannaccii]